VDPDGADRAGAVAHLRNAAATRWLTVVLPFVPVMPTRSRSAAGSP
jgi:hypothetical protein